MHYDYDVFVSYSSHNKEDARDLAERLRAHNLSVWFDDWIIKPGDIIPAAVEKGLESSRVLVLCISQQALSSEWVRLERYTATFRDPTNLYRRFIPVRFDDAPLGDALAKYQYVDWRERSDSEFKRLLAACVAPDGHGAPESVQQINDSRLVLSSEDPIVALAMSRDGKRAVCATAMGALLSFDPFKGSV